MLFYIVYVATIISLSEAISCPGSAKYKLTFKAEWTAQTHPEDFPSGDRPHFSSLVGCSHNASYVMWKPRINATRGVKDVAETGDTLALNNEMDRAIEEKKALRRFQGRGISNTDTRIVNNIQVNNDYPLVSAITMIAPSPDWFVGVHDYNLCNESNGMWFDKKLKDLFLYDSGTDDAPTFVHNNTPSNPHVPIFLITNKHEGSLKSNNTIKRFGTFTFEKTHSEPSGIVTTTPSGIVTTPPSGNVTTTPSGNVTTTPSGNVTTTPSGNVTITPSNTAPPTSGASSLALPVNIFLIFVLILFTYIP